MSLLATQIWRISHEIRFFELLAANATMPTITMIPIYRFTDTEATDMDGLGIAQLGRPQGRGVNGGQSLTAIEI